MKVTVKLFGSTRESVGQKEVKIQFDNERITVADLKRGLYTTYPALNQNSGFLMVAVNRKVADDSTTVTTSDELALLPLVSGG